MTAVTEIWFRGRSGQDYAACDFRQALTPSQRDVVRQFLALLIKARSIRQVNVGRALRSYRIALNGKYFTKDVRVK